MAREIDERWNTLAKRLQWVLDQMKARVGDASAWSLAAGLHRTHVSTTINRGSSMAAERVARLAEVATPPLNLTWLSSGRGTPEAQADIQDDFADPHPERVAAITFARARKVVTEGAIAKARAFDGDEYALWNRIRWGELLLELTGDEYKAQRHDIAAQRVKRGISDARQKKAAEVAAGPADRAAGVRASRKPHRRKDSA